MNQNTLKYLALGILIGYLSPYLIALIKKQASKTNQEETINHES